MYSCGNVSEYFPVKRKGLRAGLCRLSVPPDSTETSGIRHRRPQVGERTRGAADALQTKIAVALQNLEPASYQEQLQNIVAEIPEAAGCDAAFVALISDDGEEFETVLSANMGFAQCKAEVLSGEPMGNWPWLHERLGHLKIVEVADTLNGSKVAAAELQRLSDLRIGSILMIGFCVHGEIAGFLALANEQAGDGWDARLH